MIQTPHSREVLIMIQEGVAELIKHSREMDRRTVRIETHLEHVPSREDVSAIVQTHVKDYHPQRTSKTPSSIRISEYKNGNQRIDWIAIGKILALTLSGLAAGLGAAKLTF